MLVVRDYQGVLRLAEQLESQGELVIESDKFTIVKYLIKKGHIVIIAGPNGELAVDMNKLDELIEELQEIKEMWQGWR